MTYHELYRYNRLSYSKICNHHQKFGLKRTIFFSNGGSGQYRTTQSDCNPRCRYAMNATYSCYLGLKSLGSYWNVHATDFTLKKLQQEGRGIEIFRSHSFRPQTNRWFHKIAVVILIPFFQCCYTMLLRLYRANSINRYW